MHLLIKKNLKSNKVLKVVSCILGYALWNMLTTCHTTTRYLDVPLVFYGNETTITNAPEKITIALQAKRVDLQSIDMKTLAAHINAQAFKAGPNPVIIDNKNLFLPDSIKLVHYSPLNMVVQL